MSTLQRMARSGRQEHQARAMSVPKALRLAAARSADRLHDLALAVIGITQEEQSGNDVCSALPEVGLMLLLDGPRGSPGAAILDLALVNALIQQQTTGRVTPQPPLDRQVTATDAALCAPFLDRTLDNARDLLDNDADRQVLEGFVFGARVENRRLLEMSLQASDYTVIRLTLDIAGGLHQGGLDLILPKPDVRDASAGWPDTARNDGGSSPPTRMHDVVLELPSNLSVLLCRVQIPLSSLGTLVPGAVLALPPDAFPTAQVVLPGGRVLAHGTLGQTEGKRAIRLARNDEPDRGNSERMDLGSAGGALSDDIMLDGSLPPFTADMPGELDVSDLPGLPDLDSLPSIDKVSDGASSPDPDAMPDLSDLPELDGLTELSDLPELPELPDMKTP